MSLYLFSLRISTLAFTYLFDSRHVAAGCSGLLVTLLALVGGVTVHLDQLGVWVDWLRYVSPVYWMSHPLEQGEFEPLTNLRCLSNPVIIENSIIKQVQCGLPDGDRVLKYFGYTDKFTGDEWAKYAPLLITAAFLLFFQILAVIFFLGRKQKTKMSRSRRNKM